MSYTRSYTGTVTVSGDVRVSYPPSEHGGTTTEHYVQNVPINVNITVATEPFDRSIGVAKAHVDGLTASVATMNAANCANIAECSDQVSNKIIGGFYNLIQRDLTTKKAEVKTQLQARYALLRSHSDAVDDKHKRMLTDIERERAKYGTVFSELDKELERRILQIDRPAFTLSKKVKEEIVLKPYLTVAASTADRLSAGSSTSSKIAIAGLRSKVSVVLQNLLDSLRSNLMYRHMMRDALWDKSVDEEQQLTYIPVAYCVSEDISSMNTTCSCYVSDNPRKDSILSAVNSYVGANHAAPARDIPQDELKLIEQAFSSMVQDDYTGSEERSEYQERVYTEIYKLFRADYPGLKQL